MHLKESICEIYCDEEWVRYDPSTDWSQGGPIIERERLLVVPYNPFEDSSDWCARKPDWLVTGKVLRGPAPLIAAMRAYVAGRYGDEVEN